MPDNDEQRRAELVTALGAVRSRIATACEQVGRDPRSITLVAVTKTRPASDIAALASIGVIDIGENKDQEARAKIAELASYAAPVDVRWHLIGRLQTNKARHVAQYAAAVHSLDRVKLANALAEAAVTRPQPLDVFIQVSLDDDPQRGGIPESGLAELAAAVAARSQLRLRGVMAVPPLGADPEPHFARLRTIAARLREHYPQASEISAGMSDDLEVAVRNGATYVRVGTALLGRRGPIFS